MWGLKGSEADSPLLSTLCGWEGAGCRQGGADQGCGWQWAVEAQGGAGILTPVAVLLVVAVLCSSR